MIESEKKVKRFYKIPLFPLQGQNMSVYNHTDRICLACTDRNFVTRLLTSSNISGPGSVSYLSCVLWNVSFYLLDVKVYSQGANSGDEFLLL